MQNIPFCVVWLCGEVFKESNRNIKRKLINEQQLYLFWGLLCFFLIFIHLLYNMHTLMGTYFVHRGNLIGIVFDWTISSTRNSKNPGKDYCCVNRIRYIWSVRFEVYTVLSIKIAVLSVIIPCRFVEKYQRYERICCFHFQNIRGVMLWSDKQQFYQKRWDKVI